MGTLYAIIIALGCLLFWLIMDAIYNGDDNAE